MQGFRQQQEELQARQQTEARQAQEVMAREVLTEIEAFRADPKNEFFPQVMDHMTVLLANGVAQNLQEAYDQATWSRPDIRSLLSQRERGAVQKQADKQAQAQRARARGVSVRGSVGGSAAPTPAKDRTVREELQAAFADARARL